MAQGRPRGDFAIYGVDFEGSQKWVDFRRVDGRPKDAKDAPKGKRAPSDVAEEGVLWGLRGGITKFNEGIGIPRSYTPCPQKGSADYINDINDIYSSVTAYLI